jgi:drug/metabolite transporter (DMT)-like permease
MRVGFLYMILSLTCFGAIGLLVKFANLRRCRPGAVYSWAYAWCVAFSAAFVMWLRGGQFHVPAAVYAIAVPFGIMNAIGGIVFMAGVRFGKISTSWLIINLSAAIPAVGSVVLYHEPVNAKKLAVLALAAVAVLLLWKDKQEDEKRRPQQDRASEEPA